MRSDSSPNARPHRCGSPSATNTSIRQSHESSQAFESAAAYCRRCSAAAQLMIDVEVGERRVLIARSGCSQSGVRYPGTCRGFGEWLRFVLSWASSPRSSVVVIGFAKRRLIEKPTMLFGKLVEPRRQSLQIAQPRSRSAGIGFGREVGDRGRVAGGADGVDSCLQLGRRSAKS